MVKALMAYGKTVAESAVQKEIHPQILQIEIHWRKTPMDFFVV